MTEELYEALDSIVASLKTLIAAVAELADSVATKPGRGAGLTAVPAALLQHREALARALKEINRNRYR